jgi:hypothetical protein
LCGGGLTVHRIAGRPHVDCAAWHRARTDAGIYEELRQRTAVLEIEAFLGQSVEDRCREHVWTLVEELPDIRLVVCRRCLALSVVAGQG